MSWKEFLQFFWSAVRGDEKTYTQGSVDRAIVLLAIPMILEMVMEALFAVVDVFFVSRVGVNAVATVGLTESVITIVYSIAIGLSMATTAMVARRVGESDMERAALASVQAIGMAVAFSVLISVLGIWFAKDILRIMGGTPQLIDEGYRYTQVIFGGNIVIMLLFLLNGIFRGAGDAAVAMRVLWLANAINIVLDPCLIFGWGPFPELGLKGAAIATNIGRGVGVLYQLYVLFGGRVIIKILRRHLVVAWEIVFRLFRVSLGGMAQHVIASASWIVLMRLVSEFGASAVAGYTISIRLIVFAILPAWGMSNAAATLVGQNLGAGSPDRAEKSVWRAAFFAMVFLLAISIVYFIWAKSIIGLFHYEPDVVHYGVASMRIISLGYLFFAYGMVISQAFNGAGDTLTPTLINVVCFWLIQIPLAYFLAIKWQWGPNGAFWAVAISESLLAVVCIWIFRLGRWKAVKI